MLGKVMMAILALCCSAAWGQATSQPATSSPSAQDSLGPQAKLVAAALHHQARSLGHLREGKVLARAARIKVLLELAHQLDPDAPQINRDLMEFYESAGDIKAASVAAAQYLKARPLDCAVFLRWMYLTQKLTDTASQRIEFLEAVLKQNAPPGVHAAAQLQLAQIYLNQGSREKAMQACDKAIELDAHQSEALQMKMELSNSTSPTAAFEMARTGFEANPRDFQSCWSMAEQLQRQGLYDEAGKFFELCQALIHQRPVPPEMRTRFYIDYINALLDSGKDQQAIETLAPEIRASPTDLALRALLVEACRRVGQQDRAEVEITAMGAVYRQVLPPTKDKSAGELAELAWFDLKYQHKPGDALLQARQAQRLAPDDPYVQLVFGACLLNAGDVDEGRKVLAAVAATDAVAAAELASKLVELNETAEVQKVLQQAPTSRTGPGWRAVKTLADAEKVELAAPANAKEFSTLAQAVPEYLFEMARAPDKFLQMRIVAPAELPVGEPIEVTVELKNVSEYPISLGARGLIMPTLLLSVKADSPQAKGDWPNLVVLPLPAPLVLEKGQSVSETVRIDVGAAERLLERSPLTEVRLTVSALADPLTQGEKVISASPMLQAASASIRRLPFVDSKASPEVVQEALGYVVRDLQQGQPAEQMRAARQIGSLLTYARLAEQDKTQPPLPAGMTKLVLLSMLRAALASPQPAVRAEMLSSLNWVEPDSRMTDMIKPTLEDPSPLVRLEAINLLAGSPSGLADKLVKQLLQDADPFVSAMAAAFAPESK